MMKTQQQLQKAQEQAAADLAAMTIEGTAGGGAVVVSLSGDWQAKTVTIDPDAVDPEDVTSLEDLVLAALKDAMERVAIAQAEAQEKVNASALSGLKLPPGLGF